MNKDTALKMAIEAMSSAYSNHGLMLQSNPAQDAWLYHGCDAKLFKALQACKEALEQPSVAELNDEYLRDTYVQGLSQPTQAPVAWMHRHAGEITEFNDFQSCQYCEPLYTHPASSWQGLSDDEAVSAAFKSIEETILSKNKAGAWRGMCLDIARAIEQALKEKNHG